MKPAFSLTAYAALTRDNTIDVYISDEHDDVLAEGTWQRLFKEKPEVLTMEEKKEWIAKNTKVGSGQRRILPRSATTLSVHTRAALSI